MGSLFKSPKIPEPQPVRYVVPTQTSAVTSTPSEPVKTESEVQTEARQQSLLRRNRGRLGTIITSFTGFLSPSETDNRRKTLLGE